MKNPKSVIKRVSGYLILGLVFTACTKPTTWDISSPDGKLHVRIQMVQPENFLRYEINRITTAGSSPVLLPSPLGIKRVDQGFDKGLSYISSSKVRSMDEPYQLIHGKRKDCRNKANERVLRFKSEAGSNLDLTFRVYNTGIAFRYLFPEKDSSFHTIQSEETGFQLPDSGLAFMQPHADRYPAYEQYYQAGIPIGTPSPNKAGWSFPALFKLGGGKCWVLITEAGLDRSYCGTRLRQEAEDGLYRIRMPDETEGKGLGEVSPASILPWATPWRVIMVGESPGTILESTLVTDLSPSSSLENTGWIIPGRASWSWWSYSRSARDYEILKSFIDLSAEMGWEYSLIDAGWPNLGKDRIRDLVRYGSDKNVGIFLWYHSGGHPRILNDEQMRDPELRRAEFRSISEIGVKGIKADFFLSDKQFCISQYIDILEDAAEFELLVNFHGCTLPRGWTRTWPNLLTMEAVRGAEMYKFHSDYPASAPEQNTILPFTRNVAGPVDYTPAGFSDNTYPHLTSYAHELALPIILQSGLVHYIDSVRGYLDMPEAVKEMLRTIPAAWDETSYLSGYPGKDVVIARKRNNIWFVGGINGESADKQLSVDLSFLDEGDHKMLCLSDGQTGRDFEVKSSMVTGDLTITINMLPYGGFAMRLAKGTPEIQ